MTRFVRLLAVLFQAGTALVAGYAIAGYAQGCALVHRAPAKPVENMICEAVDFGDAVRIQICAGPADMQRIRLEAQQLRRLKARQGGTSQSVPPGTP